jgi:hypothetical protein
MEYTPNKHTNECVLRKLFPKIEMTSDDPAVTTVGEIEIKIAS